MKITWLGHACFELESNGFRVLLDPYREVPGLTDLKAEADAVYCSHDHFDHAHTAGVTLTTGRETPFTVREVTAFHDPEGGALRGSNTIRIFSAEDLRVVHLGDLGHPLTEEQVADIGACDAILIPVGGTYTIDGPQAAAEARKLGARVVIPMHYRSGSVGFPEIDTVEPFTNCFPAEQVRTYQENVLHLTADTPPQIALLALPRR